MTWEKAIGQDNIKRILQKQILEGRIPHAYCFWGDTGTGKEALALEFAKTVNCENPVKTDKGIEYCGECNSCRLSDKFMNPNIEIVFATPGGNSASSENGLKGKQIDEIREQMRLKSQNYYHKIQVKGGSQIRISSIRSLAKKLSMSQSIGGRRVVIVSRAEEMTQESANAFLKTLEEPHENVTIILTTSRIDQLLPTIISRCQVLHFPGLPKDIIEQYLREQMDVSEEEVKIAASFSQGSLMRALDFLDEEMIELRNQCMEMLRTALTRREYKIKLSKSINELTKDKSKRKIVQFLEILLLWLRDVEVYRETKSTEGLINIDQTDVIERFIKAFGQSDIPRAIESVEEAFTRIKRNVPLNLILLSMFVDIRSILYNSDDI